MNFTIQLAVSYERLPNQLFSAITIVFIMPKVCRTSYNMALKLKLVAEAEAVGNNSEITQEYGISESIVRRWRREQSEL